ncbi:MAG: T9SS type A sorting domain-containing protein, partial [Bacteroidota bacterium]
MAASDNLGGFNYIGDGAETGTSGGTFLSNNASNVIDIHDPNDDGADPEFNTGSGFENRGTAVISTVNDCIEYAIDFSDLNGSISQMSTLYISIMSGQDNNTFANDGDTFSEFFESDGLDGMTPGAGSGNFFGRSGGVGTFDFDIESASVPLSSANLLPVEFSAVTIKASQEGHKVNWVTASEVNNDYFELQRSTDSQTWKIISQVNGAGTTYQEQSYWATDKTPQAGRNYYRVKQVDYDGAFSFSPIVLAVWRQNIDVTLGPVPASALLSIYGLSSENESYSVGIYNTLGQLLYQEENIDASIRLSHLADGIYYLQIKDDNNAIIANKQFVIQH